MVVAVATSGKNLCNWSYCLHVDHQVLVQIINTGHVPRDVLTPMFRILHLLCLHHNNFSNAEHIPGHEKSATDTLFNVFHGRL